MGGALDACAIEKTSCTLSVPVAGSITPMSRIKNHAVRGMRGAWRGAADELEEQRHADSEAVGHLLEDEDRGPSATIGSILR